MVPDEGIIVIEDTIAIYTCDDGFYVSGNEFRICDLDTGVWSGSDPVCQRTLFFISAFHIHFSLTLSVLAITASIQMVVVYYVLCMNYNLHKFLTSRFLPLPATTC